MRAARQTRRLGPALAIDRAPLARVETSTPLSPTAQQAYLAQHGASCLAYSSTQPGTESFHLDGVGYIPFMRQGRRPYVLGDPICAPAQRERLTRAFLQHEPTAAFVQISADYAQELREKFRYRSTMIGSEHWLDLAGWNLTGRDKALLRRHRNGGAAWGLRVRTIDEAELTARRAEIDALKARWLGKRKGQARYMKFLVRPEAAAEPETRKYIAETAAGEIVSYVVCDPLRAAGRTIGFYLNLTFYADAIPDAEGKRWFRGVNYFTSLEIIRQLRQEGMTCATLGLAALHAMLPSAGEHRGLRTLLGWVWRYANAVYSFRGMAQYKEAYRGETRPVYFASRTSGFADLFAILRLSNLI